MKITKETKIETIAKSLKENKKMAAITFGRVPSIAVAENMAGKITDSQLDILYVIALSNDYSSEYEKSEAIKRSFENMIPARIIEEPGLI